MQDFATFIRVTATGLVASVLFSIIFAKGILDYLLFASGPAGPVLLTLMGTFVGLLLEPMIRRHPFREEVYKIYKQVCNFVVAEAVAIRTEQRGTTKNAGSGSVQGDCAAELDLEFYEVVAKSIYEFIVWTFPSTETYMRRVNQQVRYAYFYFSLWYLWVIGSIGIVLSLVLKMLVITHEHTISDLFQRFLGTKIDTGLINDQLLLGAKSPIELVVLFVGFVILGYFPARFFYDVGRETMLTELHSRHIALLKNQGEIREIARQVLLSCYLRQVYVEIARKAREAKERGKRLPYWFSKAGGE